ncbi:MULTISPECIES: hypothetical protein [unclassified Aureimonas]|uniref:hypothetical protein n=1 Tax=unclassified Aureimonas TaxID=2615206 RepID=UPI000A6F9DA7|nr:MULTISPECIES: hypothetical protein [unclassified Aureimonas]
MKPTLLALAALLALAGCGGMTRAVAILPNTTDDLAKKSEAFRKPAPTQKAEPARAP